jgi:sirohydrochlorin cobaltochelatase
VIQMSKPLLLLAGHGAGDDSPANVSLQNVGESVQYALPAFEVVTAFNLGSPTYAEALSKHRKQSIIIVPVMISDGYFRNVVLPRAVAEAQLPIGVEPVITPPIGHHPRIGTLFAEQVQAALDLLGQDDVPVLVVGHGSERNPTSSRSTYNVCEHLLRQILATEITPCFLDQDPLLETVAFGFLSGDIVVAPFLIGGGEHTLSDIPARIGVKVQQNQVWPICVKRGAFQAALAAPIGEHPDLPALIIESALTAIDSNQSPTA